MAKYFCESLYNGKMEANQIATKLICFRTYSVSSFQRCRNGVLKQLLEILGLFVFQVHFYGLKFNIVVKALNDLVIVFEIVKLVMVVQSGPIILRIFSITVEKVHYSPLPHPPRVENLVFSHENFSTRLSLS